MTTNKTTEIPLNKLIPFAGNVRKTHNKAFIAELAASIKAHGLQQNLIVRKEGAKYAVVAGGQRLKALLQLAKEGVIARSYLVSCKIANGDMEATELSLVENVMRDDMHPADQFEAFRDLVDKGHSTADIAARFGIMERAVQELLKLARVSTVILKAYRDDKLKLEHVKAFAVTDDREAQERLFKSFGRFTSDPRQIRAALTEKEIPTDDRRVKFVRKAYDKAGGGLRPDWFGKDENSGFILDQALLGKLVAEKLDHAKLELAKEGWKWTEAFVDFGYDQRSQFRLIHPAPVELPRKLANEVAKLEAEFQKLEKAWEKAGEDAEYPDRCEEIRERLNKIERDRERVWKPEQLAMAGAVVAIGQDGKPDITRGLVRPEDMPKQKGKAKGKAAASGGAEGEDEKAPGLSVALTESLSAHRSAALAAELTARPDVALAAVVQALAERVFFDTHMASGSLQVAAYPQSLSRVDGSKAFLHLEADRKKWTDILPEDGATLLKWCLEQTQETLLKLLAFCAAVTVDAVQGKPSGLDEDRLHNASALASAIKLDMAAWFAPDAGNYFSRVSKPQILDALKEARKQPNAPAWEKMKKGELAALAERELAGKGWLPELLRPAA